MLLRRRQDAAATRQTTATGRGASLMKTLSAAFMGALMSGVLGSAAVAADKTPKAPLPQAKPGLSRVALPLAKPPVPGAKAPAAKPQAAAVARPGAIAGADKPVTASAPPKPGSAGAAVAAAKPASAISPAALTTPAKPQKPAAMTAAERAQRWTCVKYVQAYGAVALRGDGWQWWDNAAGHYDRGHTPKPGAVMVLKRTGHLRSGHVAIVSRVIDKRTILVDHANWGWSRETRGKVHVGMKVVDVSPRNDWSQTRFWFEPGNTLGSRTYPTYGFIYAPGPQRPRLPEVRGARG